MNVYQSVQRPFGINVFGSAIVRVEPDVASLRFSVSRLEQRPQNAFKQARQAAQAVREHLAQAQIKDVGSSRITLEQSFEYKDGVRRSTGYNAQVSFHVLLRDLDRIEDILSGVIEAGANLINSVDFQTSRLGEFRAEARRLAMDAARAKAEGYCQAAGVVLGTVIHIEDVNPNRLQGREGHIVVETPPDDEGPLRAFDPASIKVGAAVMVSFEIEGE